MKRTILLSFSILFATLTFAQTTATDFSVDDCDGNFHNLFSELDEDRTERLLHLLVADQTFITTAIELQIIEKNTYREIENGKLLN